MKHARASKSKVGACVYTRATRYCYAKMYGGFNIENRCHKGYHAEEVALLNAIAHRNMPDDFEGIVIVYKFAGHDSVYPGCGHCRQLLWEYTNKDLLITVVDTNGKIRFEKKLGKLYPFPYPEVGKGV